MRSLESTGSQFSIFSRNNNTFEWFHAYTRNRGCDSCIRWVRQDNIGERAARARVSLTRAPKIVCLDADVRLHPNALARYVSFLDKHIAAGVACDERRSSGDLFGLESRAVFNNHHQGDVLESILRARFSPHLPRLVCVERRCDPRSGCSAGLALSQGACSRRASCARGTSCGSIRR